jgi:hypothetical protein
MSAMWTNKHTNTNTNTGSSDAVHTEQLCVLFTTLLHEQKRSVLKRTLVLL